MFHAVIPFLLLWLVYRLGYDRRARIVQAVFRLASFAVCFFFTDRRRTFKLGAFMGKVPPFVMRFDTGSVPVGYLVLCSATKTITEIQDEALLKCGRCFRRCRDSAMPIGVHFTRRAYAVLEAKEYFALFFCFLCQEWSG